MGISETNDETHQVRIKYIGCSIKKYIHVNLFKPIFIRFFLLEFELTEIEI